MLHISLLVMNRLSQIESVIYFSVCVFSAFKGSNYQNLSPMKHFCSFLKTLSPIPFKSFFFFVNKRTRHLWSLLKNIPMIANYLNNSDRNPRNQLIFQDAKMQVTFRILEDHQAFQCFNHPSSTKRFGFLYSLRHIVETNVRLDA